MFDPHEASRRREEGQTRARTAVHYGWKSKVEAAIDELASLGREFTAEDVRAIAGDPIGSSTHALGALIAQAAKQGKIVATGYTQAKRPEAHQRPIRTWRGLF